MDWGATLTPALGGPSQRVNRMGSRFRISVSMPPLPSAILGRQWVNRLVMGKAQGVRMPLPLLDFNPGTTGTIKVNLSGQSGMTLNVKGATAGYQFKEGQPFSIQTGGKHYLYMVAADTTASGTGTAALPLSIMLRKQHLDNDVCFFSQPMIEGFVSGDEIGWELSIEHNIGLNFDIAESE